MGLMPLKYTKKRRNMKRYYMTLLLMITLSTSAQAYQFNDYSAQGSYNNTNSGNYHQEINQLPPAPSFNSTFIPPNGNSGWQAGVTTIFGGIQFGRTTVDPTNKDLNQAQADLMYLQGLQIISSMQCYTLECNQFRLMLYNRFSNRNIGR